MPTPSPVDAVVAKLNTALARLPAIATSITAVRLVRVYDIQHGAPGNCRALFAEVTAHSPHLNDMADVYLADLNLLGASLYSPLHDIDMWEAVQTFAKQHEIKASRAVRITPFL